MKIYVGTSGFAYKEWKGTFYPEKVPPKEMLRFYAERLRTVEINNTFYHMPNANVLASWADQVPQDFLFALKAPRMITHFKQLHNVSEETRYLFGTVPVLGRRLGPVLFQFPASFRLNAALLKDFLDILPGRAACAFEFKNHGWTADAALDLLRAKGCGLCISDEDESPADGIISTAGWGYLRLRRSEYSDADLGQWADRILAQAWERAFVFFKHEGDAAGADLAVRFQKLIDGRMEGQGTGELKKAG